MIRKLVLLVFVVTAIGAAALFWAVGTPAGGPNREVFVDIRPGTSSAAIAQQLADAGVIDGTWRFMAARTLRSGVTLKAGEYRFERPLSALEVLDKIARGDIFYHELRIPEGANIFDIAGHVEKLGLMPAAEFLKVARDPSLVKELSPDAPSLEGYLFPSTYRVTRRTTATQICREMTAQFRKVWQRIGGPGTDVNRYVTLASMVEKETGVADERTTVASVYANRLAIGMKLDADPTTLYAALLEGRHRGPSIYKSDLESTHPYNTYRNPGLPPGPIANPGEASLKAALQPAKTNYLFFVARGDRSGGHVFTETLERHNAAVRNYRDAIAQ
ncbi:MAG TPA: endolytic transglycosylase MltG [Bryobacteraceae bacterium]|nr:endolytic transglycosylase MltG [Bryobacteraceae bacterium]